MNRFVAVDVETANTDTASICQIGIAFFEGGQLLDTWETLVNPETHFDKMNVSIHGITERQVRNAPKFAEIQNRIISFFTGQIVVSHGAFDRISISKKIAELDCQWLDGTRVVRRAWSELSSSGYGLANACDYVGIEIGNHHNAVDDAIAAGRLVVAAIEQTGLSLDDLLMRSVKPIKKTGLASGEIKANSRVSMDANPEGQWYGEVLAFTGDMAMSRIMAATVASNAGFVVGSGVTKKTTILVKGLQDFRQENPISLKEQKALDLIKKGKDIVILSERDFFDMIKSS